MTKHFMLCRNESLRHSIDDSGEMSCITGTTDYFFLKKKTNLTQHAGNYCGQLHYSIIILNTKIQGFTCQFLGSGKPGLVTVCLSLKPLCKCQAETMSEATYPLPCEDA